jgi:hypothetical protein
MIISFIKRIITSSGFNSIEHFINSSFHPEMYKPTIIAAAGGATVAYYLDYLLGLNIPMGLAILVLFALEFYTGLTASKKEGKTFDSELFGKGWFKLLVYLIMLGTSHIFAIHADIKSFFGLEFNIYEWLHYGFLNYIIINLFWSNLENFKRLGWHEFSPILKRLAKYIKDEEPLIKDKKP